MTDTPKAEPEAGRSRLDKQLLAALSVLTVALGATSTDGYCTPKKDGGKLAAPLVAPAHHARRHHGGKGGAQNSHHPTARQGY